MKYYLVILYPVSRNPHTALQLRDVGCRMRVLNEILFVNPIPRIPQPAFAGYRLRDSGLYISLYTVLRKLNEY